MTRLQANLLLLTAGALWGMGFVAQSTAMAAIGPLLFIGLRFLAATISVIPFALIEARSAKTPVDRRALLAFSVTGLSLFTGMTAQQFGLLTATVTNSGFLTGLYVVFVPFLSVILFRTFPHPVVWPAAIVALTGIWLLSGGSMSALTVGDWLTILSAVFFALQVILIGRYGTPAGRPVLLATMQFAVCALLGLSGAVMFETISLEAIWRAMPSILFTGIVSGSIAFTLQTVAQSHTAPSQAAILLGSEAVFAAIFAAILLGERIGPLGYAGCALIFAAIVAVEAIPALIKRENTLDA